MSGSYRHELSHDDHRELVGCLLWVRGMVVLSGYAHETYAALERAGWARINYPTCTHGRVRSLGGSNLSGFHHPLHAMGRVGACCCHPESG